MNSPPITSVLYHIALLLSTINPIVVLTINPVLNSRVKKLCSQFHERIRIHTATVHPQPTVTHRKMTISQLSDDVTVGLALLDKSATLAYLSDVDRVTNEHKRAKLKAKRRSMISATMKVPDVHTLEEDGDEKEPDPGQ